MKPHIKMIDGNYWCHRGKGLVGCGKAPEEAYLSLIRCEREVDYLVEKNSASKKKPADNQTGLFWRWMFILAVLAFLGSFAAEIASLCW